MMFDPLYLMIMGVGLVISLFAQAKVKMAMRKYSQIPSASGLTGAQAASQMLRANGISGVGIEQVSGFLSDHYDPRKKVLRLSPDIYGGTSVAALGVACHEAGHALQDAKGYAPLFLRNAMVPVASFGSTGGIWMIVIGMVLGAASGSGIGSVIAMLGFYLLLAGVIFTVVTLPVEFNASSRAKTQLVSLGMVRSPEEQRGVTKVLNAAAMTYVAAATVAILQLFYWAMRLGLLGGRSDD